MNDSDSTQLDGRAHYSVIATAVACTVVCLPFRCHYCRENQANKKDYAKNGSVPKESLGLDLLKKKPGMACASN